MALSELTEETRAKINDLLKYWKKWEHVKDADVLPLLDEIAITYEVVSLLLLGGFVYLTLKMTSKK